MLQLFNMNEMHSIVQCPPRTAPHIVEARMMCTGQFATGYSTLTCHDLHAVVVVSPASREFSRVSRCSILDTKRFFIK